MVDIQFFEELRQHSQIKARIIQKYFWAWAKVIMPSAKRHDNRILYIDLFAGPGRYDDGTLSTPLLVLQKAIEDPDMRSMLVTLFNDRDADNAGRLKQQSTAYRELKGLSTSLRFPMRSSASELLRCLRRLNLFRRFSSLTRGVTKAFPYV